MNTKNKNKSNYKLHQENIIKDLKPEEYLPQIGEFGIATLFETNTLSLYWKIT
tara:strand:+ start:506 stop:664 length:159 start_codon:yes stop_codon:yes gene_type:complete